MKICIFTTDWPPTVGGISSHGVRLVDALALSPEVECISVVALQNKSTQNERRGRVNVLRRTNKSLHSLFLQIARHMWQFRHHDIFHAQSVFPVGFFCVLIGRYLMRKKVFVNFYGTDMMTSQGNAATKWAKTWTVRHATHCVSISNSSSRLVADKLGMRAADFSVVYTPLEDERESADVRDAPGNVRKELGIKVEAIVLLFVGNLVKRKGASLLIQAVAMLNTEALKLIIVGRGQERENLEKLVQECKLEEHIFIVGRVKDIEPYYAAADIFSMPSFFERGAEDVEGQGIVYIEAQERGIPVIATRSGGIPEVIDENRSGLIVPESDIAALAEAIRKLTLNKELRKDMGERGKVFVQEKFSPESIAKRQIQVYKRA